MPPIPDDKSGMVERVGLPVDADAGMLVMSDAGTTNATGKHGHGDLGMRQMTRKSRLVVGSVFEILNDGDGLHVIFVFVVSLTVI